MASRKRSAAPIPFIRAELDQLRMFAEHAQINEGVAQLTGEALRANVALASEVGLGFIASEQPPHKLGINFVLRMQMVPEGMTEPFLTYQSEYRATFLVEEMQNVDPSNITVEAVQTYISQVEWLSRARVLGTLVQFGLGGVVLPKSEKFRSKGVVVPSPSERP